MGKSIRLSFLATGLLAALLLAGCSGQNPNQTKIVAGKMYRDVSIKIVAEDG